MAAHQAPPSLGFSRQEHWSQLPFPPPIHASEVAQSCPTPSDPMDCSLPGCSVHAIFQARILEWVAIPFSEVLLSGFKFWSGFAQSTNNLIVFSEIDAEILKDVSIWPRKWYKWNIWFALMNTWCFPGGSEVKGSASNEEDLGLIPGFNLWVGKIPWRRKWQPTPVFLTGESHGQRTLVGYSPQGRKESDTTWATSSNLISSQWILGSSKTFYFNGNITLIWTLSFLLISKISQIK